MGKDSFVACLSWGAGMRQLPDEEAGRLIKAVFAFAEDGALPEGLSPSAEMAFVFISDQLLRDAAKYAQRCKSAAKRGRPGAETRWGEPMEAAPMAIAIPIADTDTDTVTDTVTDTEYDTVTDTETVTVAGASPVMPVSGAEGVLEGHGKKRETVFLTGAEYTRKLCSGVSRSPPLRSF